MKKLEKYCLDTKSQQEGERLAWILGKYYLPGNSWEASATDYQ
jgi:hypothetical protein